LNIENDEELDILVSKIMILMSYGKSKNTILKLIPHASEDREHIEKLINATFKVYDKKEGNLLLKPIKYLSLYGANKIINIYAMFIMVLSVIILSYGMWTDTAFPTRIGVIFMVASIILYTIHSPIISILFIIIISLSMLLALMIKTSIVVLLLQFIILILTIRIVLIAFKVRKMYKYVNDDSN